MAEVIRMPRLSDTMEEGKIMLWHKQVGDKVKPGDVLADVETDKATMELESYNEGVLLYIGVEAGKAAKVEGILAVIGKEGEDFKSLLTEGATKTPAAEAISAAVEVVDNTAKPKTAAASEKVALPDGAKEIRMPLLSDTMTEGKIVAWHKEVGDNVKADDVLADVETDKATMEVVGYEEGTLLYRGIEAGSAAQINEIIAIVGKAGTDVSAYVKAEKSGANNATSSSNAEATEVAKPSEKSEAKSTEVKEVVTEAEAPKANSNGRVIASPLAKKLAEEKGIDLNAVSGTGDGGRIIQRDIENYKPAAKPAAAATSAAPAAKAAPAFTVAAHNGTEGHKDVELTQMRKVIAKRLSESKFNAPHFYLTIEVNMDNAMAARTQMNEISPVKISFNDMLIKAAAMALVQHPDVNSSWMGDFIRQNQHVHVGSALALPEGLIVPVIKFANEKSLSQIAGEAKALYQKAKDKKLQPAEFSGNTFTISNLGMMGIEEFTAIINPPDSAILAVGSIKETAVVKDGAFAVANIMKLTLSCDHRSVDGAVGASFLGTLRKYMENPVMMLV